MNNRRSKDPILLCPSADGWEAWPSADGDAPRTGQSIASPAEVHGPVGVMGLPSRYLQALPLWLVNVDPTVFPDMIRLQLERRGLLPPGAAMRWRIVTRNESRTLVLALVLDPDLPPDLLVESAARFEPAAALRPLPDKRAVLFRESDRLVLVCGTGGAPATIHALGDRELTPDVLFEIHATLLELDHEGVFPRPEAFVLWSDFSAAETALLRDQLGLAVESPPAPAPRAPGETWDFTPPAVEVARTARSGRQRRTGLVLLVAAIYLLLAAVAAAHYGWLTFEHGRLSRDVEATAPTVDSLKQTSDHWRVLELALDPDMYPVERLHRASRSLPPDGVRFTLFEQRGAAFLIRGEAMNAPAAFQFKDKLNNDPDWAGYQWQMPQPRLLPNNSAQFQLESTRGNAPVNLQ